jgi:hypothetical protein
MRFIISFFTVTALLGVLTSHSQTGDFKPSFSAAFDTAQGKYLLSQCSRSTPKNIAGFWTISTEDVNLIESYFKKIYSLTAEGCCWQGRKLDSLKNYGFQYVGVVINLRKYIYVNAFRLDEIELLKRYKKDFDPTKQPIKVCDGGNDFWGVLFEVKTKKFSHLSFNGQA